MEKYEAKLDTWIGESEDSLIASWGVPDKTYDMRDGKKAVEYVRRDIVETGGYAYTLPQTTYETGTIGDQAYSGTSTTYTRETEPVQKYRLFCQTSFVIDQSGKIESWHHEGNNCVSH
jgi:predicted transcriptional regulator